MKPNDPQHDPPLSETDVQAYADGLLAPERAADLRRYLGQRPGEARRVAFYGKLNQQIQQAFQPTDEPLQAAGTGNGSSATGRGRWFTQRVRAAMLRPLRTMLMLVAALVLALAAVGGWMTASQVSGQMLNNAAVMALAQATGEHFAPAAGSSDESSTVGSGAAAPAPATPAADRVTDPAAPNLAPVGMHLASERTLTLGPVARAAEYVYLNAEAQPIVLLVARAQPAASAEPQWSAQRVGTLRLLTWTAGHQRYVLAGAADAHGLMRAADFLTMR